MADAGPARRVRASKWHTLKGRVVSLKTLLEMGAPIEALDDAYQDAKVAKKALESAHEDLVVVADEAAIAGEGEYLALMMGSFTKLQASYFKRKAETEKAIQTVEVRTTALESSRCIAYYHPREELPFRDAHNKRLCVDKSRDIVKKEPSVGADRQLYQDVAQWRLQCIIRMLVP